MGGGSGLPPAVASGEAVEAYRPLLPIGGWQAPPHVKGADPPFRFLLQVGGGIPNLLETRGQTSSPGDVHREKQVPLPERRLRPFILQCQDDRSRLLEARLLAAHIASYLCPLQFCVLLPVVGEIGVGFRTALV